MDDSDYVASEILYNISQFYLEIAKKLDKFKI